MLIPYKPLSRLLSVSANPILYFLFLLILMYSNASAYAGVDGLLIGHSPPACRPGNAVQKRLIGGSLLVLVAAQADTEAVAAPYRASMPPPLTTAFVHDAYAGLSGFDGEPLIKAGLSRFRKRSVDVYEGLSAEELSAEPAASVAVLPDEEIAWPQFTPPDITRGPVDRMDVTITFDGGSEDADAGVILGALAERGIQTTIFLTGAFIKKYPDLVRQMVRDGHEIGNHTMTHPHLTDYERTYRQTTRRGVDRVMVVRELREAAAVFKDVTGTEMAPLWRAPYGEANDEIRRWAFEEGYVHVGWTYDHKRRESLDTLDWVDDVSSRLYRTSDEIRDRVLNFGKGGDGVKGGIILMHLGTERKTDRASAMLGEMIDGLAGRGYRFVKISKLIEGGKTFRSVLMIRKERIMKGLVRLGGQ